MHGSFRYGSRVGSASGVRRRRTAAFARRPSSLWVLRLRVLSGALALLITGGCSIERSPELGDTRRETLNNIRLPARTNGDVVTEDQFGNGPTPMTPTTDATVGGMQCADRFCPFVSGTQQQCCTDASDVESGTARELDLCGLSFAQVQNSSFGDACWQRDQGGVIDESCPPLEIGGSIIEMGCCTNEGLCGTLNTESGVGCHYADGIAPRACEGKIVTDVDCDPLGVFGVRIGVDVAWGGRSGGLVGLTDNGRDQITIDLRIEIQSIDGDLRITGLAQPCSVELPPFYSTTLCESYKPIFPTTIWDSPTLPAFPLSGSYQCLSPGCILSIDAQTTLLGIELDNPESPWPHPSETFGITCPAGTGEECFPDQDDDGLPGLTVLVQTGGMAPTADAPPGTGCRGAYSYFGAPLSASPAAIAKLVRRTDRIQLGTRTKLGGAGVIDVDCNGGLGSGIAEFVQSRAWGCLVQEGTANWPDIVGAGPTEPCMAAEAAFMDENLPIYEILLNGDAPPAPITVPDMSPSIGPTISMKRLGAIGDAVTCEDVRSADYPE